MTSEELDEGILGRKSPQLVGARNLKAAEKEERVVVRSRKGSRFVCSECGKRMPPTIIGIGGDDIWTPAR